MPRWVAPSVSPPSVSQTLDQTIDKINNLALPGWLTKGSAGQTRARYLKPLSLPMLVSIVLSVAIIWQLVEMRRIFIGRDLSIAPIAPIVNNAATVTPPILNPQVDVQKIAAGHLFGQFVSDVQEAPFTPLTDHSVALTGVVAFGDGSGFAMVGDSAQNTRLYRRGERLPGNYQLIAIHQRHIVMERDGVRVALALPHAGGPQTVTAVLASNESGNDDALAASSDTQQEEAALQAMRESMRVVDPLPLVEKPVAHRDHDD